MHHGRRTKEHLLTMPTTCTHTLGPLLPPYWHRPFLRYIDGDQGGGDQGGGADAAAADAAGADAGDGQDDDADPEGADALGDPGKRALDAMKAARNTARLERDQAKAALAALQAQQAGTTQQHEQQLAAQRAADERANLRIKKAEIRGAARGKLADPEDALAFVDLATIEVDEDGEVDRASLDAAIEDLLRKKPHLAAQGGRRFEGGGDGGARNGGPGPRQLTEADVEKLTPEQVDAARKAGQLNKLLGVPQR